MNMAAHPQSQSAMDAVYTLFDQAASCVPSVPANIVI
jgi:hypothetical protein